MPSVMVTTRRIQNSHTGIDVSVPEYREIRGKMMSGHVEYHILVVTRLSVFKSAKHKPEDVVQFVVSKKYSDIEEFYQKLTLQYPQASLPPVPRKVLFVSESDIRERRATFDEIMRFISKDENLATSPELMDFLGTQSNVAADACNRIVHSKEQDDAETEPLDFFRDDSPTDSIPQPAANLKGTTEEKDREEEEEDILLDPLGLMKAKKPKKPVVVQAEPPKPKPRAKPALFDEEVDPDEDLFGAAKDFVPTNTKKTAYVKNDLKLFEDQDLGGTVKLGDSLLLPTACQTKDQAFKSVLDNDTEDLFRVEDDFEKLMKLGSKPAVKPKPKVPTKPPLPKKPTIAAGKVLGPAPPAKPPDHNVQTMDQIDILKYIQDNESSNQDSLSLF